MTLSNNIVSQFAKLTVNNTRKSSSESIVYGTTVKYDGKTYVKLDGSDLLTPVQTTSSTNDGDRVSVMIKNHSATIMGNITDPSASSEVVKELGNKITEFEIIIADKISTKELEVESARIDQLVSDNIIIGESLTANKASIDELEAEYVKITGRLEATEGSIEKLEATKLSADVADLKYATITDLNATDVKIYNLESTYGDFKVLVTNKFDTIDASIKNLDATYATITDMDVERARIDELEADIANIDLLEADVANIETLIFGSATGNVIQTSFANAVIAQLGNAQIKSAMIENLSADKITAGDIITNNVRVMSEDGKLLISDETIQISDNTRVRVQIGKDGAGDYSINIWDADGKLMFSEGGITDNAIKEAIIRNDMVSDDANISAYKLDINSLFSAINEDGSNTIKSSRIYLNDKEQTLDVAFTEINTTVNQNGTAISETKANLTKAKADLIAITSRTDATEEEIEAAQAAVIKAQAAADAAQADANKNADDISSLQSSVSSQGTQLSVIQGKINSKVWQEDIDVVIDDVESLETRYSELDQTVDGISATVVSHSSQISNKAEKSSVTEVRDQVSNLELSLNGFKTTVSDTYATITDLNNVQDEVDTLGTRITNTETSIVQNSEAILLRATKEELETVSDAVSTARAKANAAQETADIAKANAQTAQNEADAAKAAAEAAQEDADKAESELATTKANLESVTSRVGATESEIEAARLAVNEAQEAADKAQADANTANEKAANAQSTADTAKTNAANAQTAADKAKATADKAQADVNALDDRVITAETTINQNSENITLAAKKIMANENAIADFKLTADGLTSRVSGAETDAEQALINAANAQSDIDNLEIGGRNILYNSSFEENHNEWTGTEPEFVEKYGRKCAHFNHNALQSTKYVLQYITDKLEPDTTYTISGWILTENVTKGTTNHTCMFYTSGSYDNDGTSTLFGIGSKGFPINEGIGEWQRINAILKTDSEKFTRATSLYIAVHTRDMIGDVYFSELKLEKGNRPTDWTPAPEDMATSIEVQNAQATADSKNQTFEGEDNPNYTSEGNIQPLFTNQVPISIDTDGSIYNTVGYKEGYRIRSGGAETTSTNTCACTGYIPVHGNDVIRISGTDFLSVVAENAINVSDVNFTNLGQLAANAGNGYGIINTTYKDYNFSSIKEETNGVYKWIVPPSESGIAFIRITAKTTDVSQFIVTINEEIAYGEVGATGNPNSPSVEWKANGTESAHIGDLYVDTLTGYLYRWELTDGVYEWKLVKDSDIAAANDNATDAQNTAKENTEKIAQSESLIQQLKDSISMLVVDGSGESLMTQTTDGWVFSTESIQNQVDATSSSLADLIGRVGTSEAAIEVLSNSVKEFGVIAEYVHIGSYTYTDENGTIQTEPSIDLFETDTGFKLKITNTRILFTDGENEIVRIDSKSKTLTTPNAVVENELQIGSDDSTNGVWVWQKRANGNLGLVWKGVNS